MSVLYNYIFHTSILYKFGEFGCHIGRSMFMDLIWNVNDARITFDASRQLSYIVLASDCSCYVVELNNNNIMKYQTTYIEVA